jgi:hypothetical protein
MELALNLGSAALLSLIIIGNLGDRKAPRTELSRFLWGRFAHLMYLGLLFLAILVAFSLSEAAMMTGWGGRGMMEPAMSVLGLATGVLAIAILVLGGRAFMQVWRERKAG